MTESQQSKLIAKAQQGDKAAFEKLIRDHQQKLFSFALNKTGGNHEYAKDILQDALIKAYLNITKFRGDSSFKTWLWHIVKNQFISSTRSPSNRPLVSFNSLTEAQKGTSESVEERFMEDEKRRSLRKLIAMLPTILQEAVTLIDYQELSYEEAAELADISVSAMRSRIYQARAKLIELATQHEELFL